MAALLMAGFGSLLGCENPSSKEVAAMIAAPQGEGVTSLLRGIDYKADGTRIRKLPRQGDTSKGELLAVIWARYVAGGTRAKASWGRSSLYSCIHCALISRT